MRNSEFVQKCLQTKKTYQTLLCTRRVINVCNICMFSCLFKCYSCAGFRDAVPHLGDPVTSRSPLAQVIFSLDGVLQPIISGYTAHVFIFAAVHISICRHHGHAIQARALRATRWSWPTTSRLKPTQRHETLIYSNGVCSHRCLRAEHARTNHVQTNPS